MSRDVRHIRDEAATRAHYDLVGNGKELDDDRETSNLCVAYCTHNTHGAEFFCHDIDHAMRAWNHGFEICEACRRFVITALGGTP